MSRVGINLINSIRRQALLLCALIGSFSSYAQSATPLDPGSAEGATRFIVMKCEVDDATKAYLLRLSDRFVLAVERSDRIPAEQIVSRMKVGEALIPAAFACSKDDAATIRQLYEEREVSVAQILGTPSPLPPGT